MNDIQVRAICDRIVEGLGNLDISLEFGIEKANIVGQIRRRKTWTNISIDYQW